MNRQELKTIIQTEKNREEMNLSRQKICVCCGAGCLSSGAEESADWKMKWK